jgi:hypothetical protein
VSEIYNPLPPALVSLVSLVLPPLPHFICHHLTWSTFFHQTYSVYDQSLRCKLHMIKEFWWYRSLNSALCAVVILKVGSRFLPRPAWTVHSSYFMLSAITGMTDMQTPHPVFFPLRWKSHKLFLPRLASNCDASDLSLSPSLG